MGSKAIIYDFDGTLADTIGIGVELYNQLAQNRGHRSITEENLHQLKDESITEIMKMLGISVFEMPFVLIHLKRNLAGRMGDVKLFPGMREVMEDFRSRGWEQAIVTSNSEENVKAFLARNTLPPFARMKCGGSLFGKAAMIRRLLADWRKKPDEAVYIGDEIRDIEAAKSAGVRVISVTWGVNSADALRRHNPDFIAEKPSELIAIAGRL